MLAASPAVWREWSAVQHAEPTEVTRARFAMVPMWVYDRVTGRIAMRVYLLLAGRYANAARECWPTQQRLAEELDVSVDTIARAVTELAAAAAIQITRTRRRDGQWGRNRYHLPMDPPEDHPDHPANLPDGDEPACKSAVRPPGKFAGSGNQTQQENQTQEPEKTSSSTTSSRAAPKRASAAPARLEITPDMRAWARTNKITCDLVDETDAFLDHHRAKGSTFKDWAAAWRTWMRNTAKFARTTSAAYANSYQPYQNPTDQSVYDEKF